jgi:hypothetical protein
MMRSSRCVSAHSPLSAIPRTRSLTTAGRSAISCSVTTSKQEMKRGQMSSGLLEASWPLLRCPPNRGRFSSSDGGVQGEGTPIDHNPSATHSSGVRLHPFQKPHLRLQGTLPVLDGDTMNVSGGSRHRTRVVSADRDLSLLVVYRDTGDRDLRWRHEGENLLGRVVDGALWLDAPTVSRRHGRSVVSPVRRSPALRP